MRVLGLKIKLESVTVESITSLSPTKDLLHMHQLHVVIMLERMMIMTMVKVKGVT